ncbi:MAG: hypothetical protein VYC34_07605, partial [Planctomycetota bacterium]|nr:hypothetical protein [Planctomycetota bacterium]
MAQTRPKTADVSDAEKGRASLLRLLRFGLIAIIVAVVGFYVIEIGADPQDLDAWQFNFVTGWPYAILLAIVLAFGVIAIDVLTPEKKISTLSGLFLGLTAGVILAIALSFLIDRLVEAYELDQVREASRAAVERLVTTIKILFGVAVTYLCVSIVLQTQDQFRLVIPYVEFSKQIRGARPLILDSSAIIDGRIVDLAETGLLQEPIIVPRFVLTELQTLADSSDRMKRARGRRGLDFVTRLQQSPMLDVSIDETPIPAKGVDQMLVDLARQMPGAIVTNDSGLNRVAS